ncbi:MAG: putative addiction module antidote protein [Vampirovibrionales bacterium]
MKPFNELLYKDLQDNEFALAYLQGALEDENPQVFFAALGHFIEARGFNKTDVAKKAAVARPKLYKMLTEESNPQFLNIYKILAAVGIHIKLELDSDKSA